MTKDQSPPDLVERLKSQLPPCPFSQNAPDHDLTPADACPVCGDYGDDRAFEQPSKCKGADTRVMDEAATHITHLEAEVEVLRKALEPFARQHPHKNEDGLNGVLVPATIADVRAAKALLERREP